MKYFKPTAIGLVALLSVVSLTYYFVNSAQKSKASADTVSISFVPQTASFPIEGGQASLLIQSQNTTQKISGFDLIINAKDAANIDAVEDPVFPGNTTTVMQVNKTIKEVSATHVHLAYVFQNPEAELPRLVQIPVKFHGTNPSIGKLEVVDSVVSGTTNGGGFSIGSIQNATYTFTNTTVTPTIAPPTPSPTRPPGPTPTPKPIVPTIEVSQTRIPSGGKATVTVSGASGDPTDWVGLYRYAYGNASFADWEYLNGSKNQPTQGVSSAILSFDIVPPALYEFRLFNNKGVMLAKTPTILMVVAPDILVDKTFITAGESVKVTVTEGPADPTDFVAVYLYTAPAYYQRDKAFSWYYMNGTQQLPDSGKSSAELTFPITVPGIYEFRMFTTANNTTSLISTSRTVNVAAAPTATPTPVISKTPTPTIAIRIITPTPIHPTPTSTTSTCKKNQGDANCDGKIDLVDFEIWRKEFTGTLSTKQSDFNSSSIVDLIDYEIWRRNGIEGL